MASITRSIANRALHLRTHPRPTNLGESREILRLISEFGEVEYFRNLKYDALSHPEAALVIFKTEEAARRCLKTCPLRFRLDAAPIGEQSAPAPTPTAPLPAASTPSTQPEPHTHSDSLPPRAGPYGNFGLPHTRTYSTSTFLPTPPSRPQQTPFEPPPPRAPPSRIYQIIASPARNNFRDHINTGPYYGNFTLGTNSAAQQDLAKTVPVKGFSCVDWRKPDRLWKVARRERESESQGPGKRKTLREIWEEGKGENTG